MNCTVDPTAAEECGVRRIHNGVNVELCDIAANDVDFAVGIFHESST
jgi:hypothetical protein